MGAHTMVAVMSFLQMGLAGLSFLTPYPSWWPLLAISGFMGLLGALCRYKGGVFLFMIVSLVCFVVTIVGFCFDHHAHLGLRILYFLSMLINFVAFVNAIICWLNLKKEAREDAAESERLCG
eukprot:JP438773.1.p1 GENE.JP438773.1~~JP438773.1.p1  ORF type:complete len:122 (-),score=15.14 JP438773.1:76-441(-)